MRKNCLFKLIPIAGAFLSLFLFSAKPTLAVQCEYVPRDDSRNIIYFEEADADHLPWLREKNEEDCGSACAILNLSCRGGGPIAQDPAGCNATYTTCGPVTSPTLTTTCKFTPRRSDGSALSGAWEKLTPSESECRNLCNTAGRALCTPFCSTIGSALCCDEEKTTCESTSAAPPPPTPHTFESVTPRLEIPLPTLPSLSGFTDLTLQGEAGSRYFWVPWIGQYIAAIYKYAIGIVGILSGIMIVVGGLLWLTAGGAADRISTAKSFIESSLVGLVIALTSYLLLYAINPNLVGFEGLKVKYIEGADTPIASPSSALYEITPAEGGSRAFVSNEDYKAATGEDIPTREQITAALPAIAEAKNIDVCFLQTIVAKETNYKANKIGHDEDVPRTQVGSRVSFINSGKKYSGATFTSNAALMTDRSMRNDDAFNPSAPPDYGLDVRFTHGIGLGQFTILRENGEMTRCSDGKIGRTFSGRCYNVLELLKMNTSIEVAADLIKTILVNRAGGSPERLFYYYAGSGCSARVSQCRKMKEYADCKGNSGLASRERDDCLSWLDENKDNCKNSEYR
ncbi:MAG: pilin [Patescibacteria group bacterium]|jgi:hypothetical protein